MQEPELSKRTNIKAVSFKEVTSQINEYDNIIYLGGLYAGGVLGLLKTLKKIKNISDKKIILVTVGLADPTIEENKTNIRNHLKSKMSKEIFENITIFHLRGGIDYSKLNFAHKTMLKLLYNSVKRLPEDAQTAEDRAMIETYNKKVNFVDFSSLDRIINKIE